MVSTISSASLVIISFSALIFSQLLNIALETHKWTIWMVISQIFSIVVYISSLAAMTNEFDYKFLFSKSTILKTIIVTLVSTGPVLIVRFIQKKMNPPLEAKLRTRMS